jgi:P4 family phage/plasmid primase-like protien
MSEELAFDYDRLRYIETRGPDDKLPKRSWGGYNQDFDAADHVYTHDDLQKVPHGNWAVVDVEDIDHGSLALLVFDLDVHKAPPDFDPDAVSIPDDTLVVRSQNGGLHVYFLVHAERGELNESDFRMTSDLGWGIDIRGSAVSHHVVAPSDIPGVDTPYDVVNNEGIAAVFDPADAAERIQYEGEPLLEYDPATRGIEDLEFDRESEPPADFPTCYHRGLELRAANPDNHPNTHKVNVLTALCGLYAGYDIETVTEHFVDDFPPGNPDRGKTEYQVKHLAKKIDDGRYSPPAISTLRDYGILGEEETCDCGLEYHGGNDADSGLPPEEVWEWWSDKREREELDESNVIPTSALEYIARDRDLYDFDALPEDADELPAKAHNKALWWVENRWWDPEDKKGPDATQRDYKSRDPADPLTWEDVRYVYEAADSMQDGRLAAVKLLRSKYEFLTPRDTENLHVYDEDLGIFDRTAKYLIGRELDQNLGKFYSKTEKNEIIGRIKERTVDREDLEARQFEANYVCVKNGVLDVDQQELRPHDPKYKFTTHLPVEYDSEAAPEAVLRFLRDITKRDADVRTLLEVLGHTLLSEHDAEWKHLFLVLFGEGSNGKSTWFDVVRTFLNGPRDEARNVESLTLQQITDNRFAPSSLVGTWANIGEDLPQKKINDLGKLKDLTGGGETWVESKGEDGFNFRNRATMMFAANRPPVLGERSTAVKRRLVPVHLPYEFKSNPDPSDPFEKTAESNLIDELTTDDELSGLLNAALAALERLRKQQDVSLPESREERLELYERHSDHIKAFRVDSLKNEPGERVSKDDVYNAYTNFCNENDYAKVADSTFWRQLRQTTLNVSVRRLAKQEDGSRPRVLDGVTFKEQGEQYAPETSPRSEESEDGTQPSHPDAVPIGEVDPGQQDVASVIGEVEFRQYDGRNSRDDGGPAWTATLYDETGEAELVVWDEADIPEMYDATGCFEPDALHVKGAETGSYDDKVQLVVGEKTKIERAQIGAGETSGKKPEEDQDQLADTEEEVQADGGLAAASNDDGSPASARGKVAETLADHRKQALSKGVLVQEATDRFDDLSVENAQAAIKKALEDGELVPRSDDKLELGSATR